MSTIKQIVSAVNSGKSVPVVSLVRDRPEISAIISKLQLSSDSTNRYDNQGNREIATSTAVDFNSISDEISGKIQDAESVNELFPDMELSAQILISSILSPKDMTNSEINFTVPPGLKVSEISSALLGALKEYCTKDYKIEPLLPVILRRMLFESGSYPVAVIPESSIDAIINGVSTENLTESMGEFFSKDKSTFKSIGILGPANYLNTSKDKASLGKGIKSSMESIYTKGVASLEEYDGKISGLELFHLVKEGEETPMVSVTDNYSILKLPTVFDRLKEHSILNKVIKATGKSGAYGLESERRLTDSNLTNLFYKNANRKSANIIKVKTSNETSRDNIGEPLVMHLPSEAVIPVYTPGNEEQHVGYFVLIDQEGGPISKANNDSSFAGLKRRLSNNKDSMSSSLLAKAKSIYGDNCTGVTSAQAVQIYSDIIEADLLARLRNGIYGKQMSIGGNEEVYRIMLSRSLKSQFTQLLFIPAELMTYYAYKYDNRGIGKSLNDDLRVINSIRAMMLFAKVAAQLKNSIGRTEVKVTLDEDDPNQQNTMEKIIHAVSSTRQQAFPLGMNNAADIGDWIQKSGLMFNFENHPGLPGMNIQFNEVNSNFVEPNADLEDDLRKRSIMAYGLNPETVDSGYNAEFATTIVSNNILLNKRVVQIQDKFVPLITDNIRKVASNDGNFIIKLKDIVKSNIDKIKHSFKEVVIDDKNEDLLVTLLVQEFLSNFEANLPRPDSITLDNQMAAYDVYSEGLDKVLDNFISTSTLPSSIAGENVNQKVDEIKGVVKAAYLRRFMSENNIFKELFEMFTFDEHGNPLFNIKDIQKNYNNDLTKSILQLLKEAGPIASASDRDMDNIGVSDAESPAAEPDSSSSDSGDTGFDDIGGDDEFSLPGL